MKIYFVIFILILLFLTGSSQEQFEPDLSAFSESVLTKARSNNSINFMTADEKELVFYMNLVRLAPQVFLKTIVTPYVNIYYKKNNKYVSSLYSDLKKARALPPFTMKKDLANMAKNHRDDMAKNGIDSHTGTKGRTFTKRSKPLLNTYYGTGENLGFGYITPFENVIELLIDEGIRSLGHRKAILSTEFNCVGVAIGNHKTYQTCSVVDFGIFLSNH